MEFENNRTSIGWNPKVDEQEWQDCQHEGCEENELWELEGSECDRYKPWELEYGREEIGVGEHRPKGPKFKEWEYQEPENVKNQSQGLGFDPDSATTSIHHQATPITLAEQTPPPAQNGTNFTNTLGMPTTKTHHTYMHLSTSHKPW